MGAKLNSVQDYLPLPWDDKLSGKELAAVINTIKEAFMEWNNIPQTLKDEEDENKNNEENQTESKNV